ncbi:hypothetical protein G4B88_022189 [Cannabis sativa]|uniref:Uncharacterized protein n=1 Tax=Cannabis sativa TaxID=3483 RepID=A0A7J6FY63_CANSA|nr:hypothetical protein G4B88_022189 [Cannabis sativa]
MGYTPLLNSHMASVSCLSAPRSSVSVMIPTPVNPNQGLVGGFFNPMVTTSIATGATPAPSMTSGGMVCSEGPGSLSSIFSQGLSSVSTDSVLVSANSSSSNPDLVAAARSLADALPSLALSRPSPAAPVFTAGVSRLDPNVKGKGLACASGTVL